MPVLASGKAPQPPPVFDPAAHEGVTFDPPLKKETQLKVLKSGFAPKPPPVYEPQDSDEFDPPLKQAQAQQSAPPRTFTSIPKVLASGRLPEPPPAFDPAGVTAGEFDPPVTFMSEANSAAVTEAKAIVQPAGADVDAAGDAADARAREERLLKRKAPST